MNHETFQGCSAAAVRRLAASLPFSTIMLIIFLKGMENVRNHFYSQKTELSIHLCLSFFSGIQIWHCIFSWYIRIWIKFHCIYLLLVCSFTLFFFFYSSEWTMGEISLISVLGTLFFFCQWLPLHCGKETREYEFCSYHEKHSMCSSFPQSLSSMKVSKKVI